MCCAWGGGGESDAEVGPVQDVHVRGSTRRGCRSQRHGWHYPCCTPISTTLAEEREPGGAGVAAGADDGSQGRSAPRFPGGTGFFFGKWWCRAVLGELSWLAESQSSMWPCAAPGRGRIPASPLPPDAQTPWSHQGAADCIGKSDLAVSKAASAAAVLQVISQSRGLSGVRLQPQALPCRAPSWPAVAALHGMMQNLDAGADTITPGSLLPPTALQTAAANIRSVLAGWLERALLEFKEGKVGCRHACVGMWTAGLCWQGDRRGWRLVWICANHMGGVIGVFMPACQHAGHSLPCLHRCTHMQSWRACCRA